MSQLTQCAYIGAGEGGVAPPLEPRPPVTLRDSQPSGGPCPRSVQTGAPMRDRRTVRVHARVSPAELADCRAKAVAAGVPVSDLRQAMARTRTWTAPAAYAERERIRQDRPHRQQSEPARPLGPTCHASAVEAVKVIAYLVAFERELHKVARLGGDGGDAHAVPGHRRPIAGRKRAKPASRPKPRAAKGSGSGAALTAVSTRGCRAGRRCPVVGRRALGAVGGDCDGWPRRGFGNRRPKSRHGPTFARHRLLGFRG